MLLVVSSSPNACWTCSSVRSDNLPTSAWILNGTQAPAILLNILGYIRYPLLCSQVASSQLRALACLGWFRLVTSLAVSFVSVYRATLRFCCATNFSFRIIVQFSFTNNSQAGEFMGYSRSKFWYPGITRCRWFPNSHSLPICWCCRGRRASWYGNWSACHRDGVAPDSRTSAFHRRFIRCFDQHW